jgi:glucokinase
MGKGSRVGIDVGGTKALAVALDADGEVIAEARAPSPKEPAALVATLAKLARAVGPASSLGVGVPGLVTRAGVLRAAPHLTYVKELPLRHLLEAQLGPPVLVANDATCATVAEWRIGAGADVNDLVMITLGTGIGGGIVAGGTLLQGVHGFAGEIGHVVVDPTGPFCPCGRRGCWERMASGTALARYAAAAAARGELDSVVEAAGGNPGAVTGELVVDAARQGDEAALALLDELGRWIAVGLVNLTNTLDPACFVLGGGLAGMCDLLVGPTRHWFNLLLYAPEHRPHPEVRLAMMGERAGAIGAAILGGDGDVR